MVSYSSKLLSEPRIDLPLSLQTWDYKGMYATAPGFFTWILGLELRSSCLQVNHYTLNYLSPSVCFQFSNQTLENTSILFILYTKPCLSPWLSDASPGLSTGATISLTSVPSTFSFTQIRPLGLLAGYQANLVFSFNPLWPHLECSLSLSPDARGRHHPPCTRLCSHQSSGDGFSRHSCDITSPTQHSTYLHIAFFLNYLRN